MEYNHELIKKIEEKLVHFTPEESEILKLRHGIGQHLPKAIHEIAKLKNKSFCETRDLLRNVEKRLLNMMRSDE